jgi:hypothetical protein
MELTGRGATSSSVAVPSESLEACEACEAKLFGFYGGRGELMSWRQAR